MVFTRGASKKRQQAKVQGTLRQTTALTASESCCSWDVWNPKIPVPDPVFEDIQENALVVPDLTTDQYLQLSRRTHKEKVSEMKQNGTCCNSTATKSINEGQKNRKPKCDDDSDSLELMLMDSLQEAEEDEVRGPMPAKPTMYVGAGSLQKDQSIYLALQAIGFDSWNHFIGTVIHNAGDDAPRGRKWKKKKASGKVTLSDILNGTSPYYHHRFARAYQTIRKNLRNEAMKVRDIESLKDHSTLTLSWSELTAEEHSWYLMHQHQQLVGAEAKRFNQLKQRIQKETIKYMEELKTHAQQHKSRYDHMTERQNAQLFADDERRRERIHALFPFASLTREHTIQDCTSVVQGHFKFVSVLHTEGHPLEIKKLEQGHSLPGDKHYLPAITTRNASRGIYKKNSTDEIHNDATVKKLLHCSKLLLEDVSQQDKVVLVATAGAFRALLTRDCIGHGSRELEIPITVDTNVWYLGKPLMEKSLMAREKQSRLQKYAVLSEAMQTLGRQAVYSLWQHSSTGIQCIVRSHSTVLCSGIPSVISMKPEYLPLPDREDLTAQEVARWRAALCLDYPSGARHIQVAHICVPRGKILSWSTFELKHLQQMYPSLKRAVHQNPHGGMEFESMTMAALVAYAIEENKKTPQQRTLLARLSSGVWEMFSDQRSAQSNGTMKQDAISQYDLHAAHHTSTSMDIHSSPWVPPVWRPYSDTVAQVPYTFPPYCVQNASEVSMPKRRRVRRTPWNGDLDNPGIRCSIQDQETQPTADYMRQLRELD